MSANTESDDEAKRLITDELRRLNDRFQTEYDNTAEMSMHGLSGFHSFFKHEEVADDPTAGMTTAMHQAFERTVRELWLDADIIRDNQGEVTPAAIAEEAKDQMDEFLGCDGFGPGFSDRFANNLEEVLEARQEAIETTEDEA